MTTHDAIADTFYPRLGQPLYHEHCKAAGETPEPWQALTPAVQEFWARTECALLRNDVDVDAIYGIGAKGAA